MRPKRKVEQLSTTIEKLLASRGLASRLKEYRVFGLWGRAVGKVIAQHAQPSMVRGKKLTVTVDSSAWMQQLSLLKPEIIEKLNGVMGAGTVESITLKLGELDARAQQRQPEPARELPPLSPGERERIEELASSIPDPEVRRTFQHLVEMDFRAKRAKRP
jgi:predicted nucleic acid-binding Zn ribbon protein